ncbi:aminotransferase-like domain-containing protein [Terrisporobacter sp.]|uniref:aminotransferase-like domain-containing protein n=1 Tax=Terrisporobacter sp. TaxID=1965305 RepID=UPI0026171E44|nr:PLP-dependent aminotransferase family protein [Terrisporobacter sp.]
MAVKYAKRMDLFKTSELGDILKLIEKPEIISFAGGLPASELFPVEEMKNISVKVLDECGEEALQYSSSQGYLPLRKHIAERMNKKNQTNVSHEDILITSGSQQALDFAGNVFLDEGDVVLCESPSYLGALNAFKGYQPKIVEIETDKEGMLPEALEKALKENDNVKFIYVIPDFQNPTGITWSLERRKKFMEVVNEYEIPVLEDNPYGELRYEGEYLPSLKALDTKGLVIYLGTFSKIFCPGYRMGWTCASKDILSKFITSKENSDLQTSTISQRDISKFIDEYDLDAHIENIKATYKKRRDVMIKCMKEEFPKGVSFTNPHGGLFTWVELPEQLNAQELMKKCVENNVAYVPGGFFFPNGNKENYFRLNYSSCKEERIAEGIKRLGQVLKEAIRESETVDLEV